jgi:lysophospholipase L1-like esterase
MSSFRVYQLSVFILLSFIFMSFCHTKPMHILLIGDSNGEASQGWVYQLKELMPGSVLYNTSIPGNTIGFNNLNNPKLNALQNINRYLEEANDSLKYLDAIVIMLGTNDCKANFKDSLEQVKENCQKLVRHIKQYPKYSRKAPCLYLLSPPPFGSENVLHEKYKGGTQRLPIVCKIIKDVADEEHCIFVDVNSILQPVFGNLSVDGIHLSPDGQKMIALIILENLKYH